MALIPQAIWETSRDAPLLSRRKCLSAVCGAVPLALACPSGILQAAWGAAPKQPKTGVNTWKAKADAVRKLPMNQLSPSAKAKVKSLVSEASLYRRLPVQVLRCEPELYLFFVNRPDTVVNIWEILGVSSVQLRQTSANGYQADDGRGTLTNVEFLHRSHDKHLIYAHGTYDGPLLKRKINGRSLIFLRTGYLRDPDGSLFVAHQLDAFVALDSLGADLMARTLQRMFGKVADQNFTEVSKFIDRLAQKAVKEPDWVQRMADDMHKVHPKVREDFVNVANRVADKKAAQPTASKTARRG
ncbi:MAG: hypothetical protein N2C14_30845 [Planctomycetales bacterium]